MRITFLLIALAVLGISCGNKGRQEASRLETNNSGNKEHQWIPGSGRPNNSDYTKVEIYCFCFNDNSNSCTTTIWVKPSDLINSKSFLDSTSNSNVIARLQRVIFNGNENAKAVFDGVDSRFVILFKKDNLHADTVVIGKGNQFVFNEKYHLEYSFPIMDSIRSILKRDKIDCK